MQKSSCLPGKSSVEEGLFLNGIGAAAIKLGKSLVAALNLSNCLNAAYNDIIKVQVRAQWVGKDCSLQQGIMSPS